MTKSQSLRFNHVQAPIFQRFPKIVVVPPVLIHLLWWMLHRKSCSTNKKIWRFPRVSGTPQIIYPSSIVLTIVPGTSSQPGWGNSLPSLRKVRWAACSPTSRPGKETKISSRCQGPTAGAGGGLGENLVAPLATDPAWSTLANWKDPPLVCR